MGYFRFFRRTKIGPGIALNLSKSGLSLSVGPRGAKMTVGPRGVRRTVGVPGTGAYYTSTTSTARRRPKASSGAGLGTLVLCAIVLALILAYWQLVILLVIGAVGIGLICWALRRGRAEAPEIIDPAAVLMELEDLHRAGVLSDAEYEQKRAAMGGPTSDQ